MHGLSDMSCVIRGVFLFPLLLQQKRKEEDHDLGRMWGGRKSLLLDIAMGSPINATFVLDRAVARSSVTAAHT